MSQQTTQREPLAIPEGVTTLVATMSWDLPGVIQPEPWTFAYKNGYGVISGQHAHAHCRKTRGGVILQDYTQRITTVNLAALNEQSPEADGVSFIANLYFGPQSQVSFCGLAKASIEIGGLQHGNIMPITRHDIDLGATDLRVFQLPLASIEREADGSWSIIKAWCPLR